MIWNFQSYKQRLHHFIYAITLKIENFIIYRMKIFYCNFQFDFIEIAFLIMVIDSSNF